MRFLAAALACVFALMAVPVRANEVIKTQQYASGQLVQGSDLMGDLEAVRNLSGILATLLLGNANALPANNPLAVSLSNAAMTFSVGGAGQFVIALDAATAGSGNARVIDSCPAQTITIPANGTGSTRTDLLSIQYQQLQTNPHSAAFSNGTVSTVYNAVEGCAYSYNTATTTPPTGYVAFARIAVPAGATTASQATVTYLIQTVGALLGSQLGGLITSLNGATGAVTLAAGTGISIATAGSTITVSATGATSGVSALNTLTGALSLESTDGSITVTTPDASHVNVKANFPVNTTNGLSGAVVLAAGTGIGLATSGQTLTFSNAGVTSLSAASSLSLSGSTGSITITPQILYDVAASTYRGTGHLCVGAGVTNSSSQLAVTCPGTILSVTTSYNDPSQTSPANISVVSVSGSTVTFGAKYTGGSATGAGFGIFYSVYAY